MRGPRPPAVILDEAERQDLDALVRQHRTPQQIAVRARIVLLAGAGQNNSQIARQVGVPWRMYANARRSTLPGASGSPGGLRSSACTPVSSSVLRIRSPAAASVGAAWYSAFTSATFASRAGSGAGVSQERMRCGCRSPL